MITSYLSYPHAHQSCYEYETTDPFVDILSSWKTRELLQNITYEPLINPIEPWLTVFPSLPLYLKTEYIRNHKEALSFKKFVEDYPKNRLYYELLKSMEGVK